MQTRLRPNQVGIILAGGGMLLVSLESLGIRLAESDSWDIAFWFGCFTLIAMVILVPLRTGKAFVSVAKGDGVPVLISGVLQGASTTFFILAINLTTVANTVVIIAAAPVVAALIARIFIGERTSRRMWLAIAASMAGIVVVASGSLGVGRLEGDLFAIAAIASFGANITLWRRHPSMNRMVAIGLGGAAMALAAAPIANPFDVGARALFILALLGGVTGPAGRVAIASATRYLTAAQVSLFAPVETVAATTWAWVFLTEAPPPATVVGGIVVLLAVIYGSTARSG